MGSVITTNKSWAINPPPAELGCALPLKSGVDLDQLASEEAN